MKSNGVREAKNTAVGPRRFYLGMHVFSALFCVAVSDQAGMVSI